LKLLVLPDPGDGLNGPESLDTVVLGLDGDAREDFRGERLEDLDTLSRCEVVANSAMVCALEACQGRN